jgi:nucleoside-diphosphate-sugar epimerase
MKILLTGGTGFIGSHFLRLALTAGHEVVAVRRSLNSQTRINLAIQPQWLEAQFDQVSVDQLVNCEVVVHLAAHTGNVPYDNLENCLRWNLMAVLDLFEKARIAGIQRFIVAGSCFEYGRSGERFVAIPSDAPLEPTNSYAASKAAATIALTQWANEYNISLQVIRVFHVFGDGELESRFWPSLRRAALTGLDFPMTAGEQIRDFQPVEDVARKFLEQAACLLKESPSSQVVNLSSGSPTTIREFAQYWWKIWGASGRIRFGELPYRESEVMSYIPGAELISLNQ